MNVKGKVAIITSGASGLGTATARKMAASLPVSICTKDAWVLGKTEG